MAEKIAEQIKTLRWGAAEIFSVPELHEKVAKAAKTGRQLRIKLGLDPTSADIHLGHTVVLRKMRQFQDLGHKAVLIIGDYTARIGDPSGQDKTRPMLHQEQIEENAKTYLEQAGKILDTSEEKLEVKYNSEWLSDLRLADIIKLTSSMTVARMLERDIFEVRYKKGNPISIYEFLYPLMQGYDSVIVQSDVELGGTDQTFNNLVGRDIQRLYGQDPQIVITMPILIGLDGKEKMSKSKDNYIGVTDEPGDMFGKIMSISDDMMEKYFVLLTNKNYKEIAKLLLNAKDIKVQLGKAIVEQFYDKKAADLSAAQFDKVFAQGQLPDDIPEIQIAAEPIMISKLVVASDLVISSSEAKRMIRQSAVSIDGEKINDPNAEITPRDGMVIQVGKRKFAKLTIT